MNKHKIESIDFRTSAKGKSYAKAMIDGKEVTIFADFYNFPNLKAGDEVEGEITKGQPYNGKDSYTLNKPVSAPAWATKGPAKASMIAVAQEKKQEGIQKSQDRKEESIKVSATARDATILTQVWANKCDVPFLNAEDIQKKWLEFRSFLDKNFDNSVPF